jgi:DNA-binding NarL/FixJ family response regulator
VKSVFLIDDHEAFRSGLKMMLESWPWINVSGEFTGVPHLPGSLFESRPNLVFIDVHLKSCNSFSIIAAIHARFPETKIILLSMFAEHGYTEDGLASGACAVLFKPSIGENLEKLIQKLCPDEFPSNEKIIPAPR